MGPSFDIFYTLEKKLQGGSYGTVFVGVHNLSEREYAVKVVNRKYVTLFWHWHAHVLFQVDDAPHPHLIHFTCSLLYKNITQ